MRAPILTSILLVAACGEDSVKPPDVDTQTGNHPDPRVIAGGGIGDGAIDGVVNLYVIDDTDRTPISGAEVRVGTVAGTTDSTGLFIAQGVVGAQDIVVKASGHRKEFWVGANGANVTIDLEKDLEPTPPNHTFSGSITGYTGMPFTPAANHVKLAIVTYSNSNDLGDPANSIATTGDTNLCFSQTGLDACNFTVTTRQGKLALIATVLDLDTKGTTTGADDTSTLIGFAIRQGIDTASSSGNQDLTVIADANTNTVSIDLGTAPTALTQHGALVSIEIGDEGQLAVGSAFGVASPSLKVPKLSAVSGATGYRLVALASDGMTKPAESIALRRNLSGTALAAGTYLAPPTAVALTRTGGSWTNSSGATVHGVELTSGATKIINVTTFDSSRTSFELPDLIALPSGPIDAKVQAIGATGFDVTNFSLDDDLIKLDRVADQQTTIN